MHQSFRPRLAVEAVAPAFAALPTTFTIRSLTFVLWPVSYDPPPLDVYFTNLLN